MAGGRECSRRRATETTVFIVALLAALLSVSTYPFSGMKDDTVDYLTLVQNLDVGTGSRWMVRLLRCIALRRFPRC